MSRREHVRRSSANGSSNNALTIDEIDRVNCLRIAHARFVITKSRAASDDIDTSRARARATLEGGLFSLPRWVGEEQGGRRNNAVADENAELWLP